MSDKLPSLDWATRVIQTVNKLQSRVFFYTNLTIGAHTFHTEGLTDGKPSIYFYHTKVGVYCGYNRARVTGVIYLEYSEPDALARRIAWTLQQGEVI